MRLGCKNIKPLSNSGTPFPKKIKWLQEGDYYKVLEMGMDNPKERGVVLGRWGFNPSTNYGISKYYLK